MAEKTANDARIEIAREIDAHLETCDCDCVRAIRLALARQILNDNE